MILLPFSAGYRRRRDRQVRSVKTRRLKPRFVSAYRLTGTCLAEIQIPRVAIPRSRAKDGGGEGRIPAYRKKQIL